MERNNTPEDSIRIAIKYIDFMFELIEKNPNIEHILADLEHVKDILMGIES